MKDYPKLILGFSVFATGVYRPILDSDDEANKGLGQFQTTQTMVGKRVAPSPSPPPVVTMDCALRYMISLEEAFVNEPAKYDEFVKIMLLSQRYELNYFSPFGFNSQTVQQSRQM